MASGQVFRRQLSSGVLRSDCDTRQSVPALRAAARAYPNRSSGVPRNDFNLASMRSGPPNHWPKLELLLPAEGAQQRRMQIVADRFDLLPHVAKLLLEAALVSSRATSYSSL